MEMQQMESQIRSRDAVASVAAFCCTAAMFFFRRFGDKSRFDGQVEVALVIAAAWLTATSVVLTQRRLKLGMIGNWYKWVLIVVALLAVGTAMIDLVCLSWVKVSIPIELEAAPTVMTGAILLFKAAEYMHA